jgi:hypothetical protein
MTRSRGGAGLMIAIAIGCGGGQGDGMNQPGDARGGDGNGSNDPDSGPSGPPTLELVGHSDLGARGMNAGLAIYDHYAYVSFRGDGTRTDPGVLVIDIADPAAPKVVGRIGPPDEGVDGLSSRELRVVPSKKLLVVLNQKCNVGAECADDLDEDPNFKFYDLSDPVKPRRVGTFESPELHEFFLWQDPNNAERVLLYVSTNRANPGLIVLDATDPAHVDQILAWDLGRGVRLHSISVTADGATGYLSYREAGVLVVDTSELAAAKPSPRIQLITPAQAGARWNNGSKEAHSAVLVPGRPLLVATDENYDCPYGWVHTVDITTPTAPKLVGEYSLPENTCGGEVVPYSSHNPTVTAHLALVSWYAQGFVMLDTSNPADLKELVRFVPQPLESVATEEPELEGNHVLMWSYPVIKDGLIYVVDIRNGLYVLRYSGLYQAEVKDVVFLDGSSNIH